MRVVHAGVADAAEQALPELGVRVEHLVEMLAVGEVGVGDDAADQPVRIARRLARDELGLAHRRQVRRARRSRYAARHSTNTVCSTACPLARVGA